MIKKILLALAVALPMFANAQTAKFGTVNTNSVMEGMPEIATVQSQLEEASKKYENEFQKLQEEMQKKYTEYQQLVTDNNKEGATKTPDSILERRMQEIQELDQKIQQFRVTATQDLDRQQQTLMAPIQEKVLQAIKTVGAEGGFTMIIPDVVPLFTGTAVVDATPLVKAKLGLK